RRRAGSDDDVDTARVHDCLTGVFASEDNVISTEGQGVVLLVFGACDSQGFEPKGLGELNPDVAEAPDADDRDSVARSWVRHPQAAHDGVASAENRRGRFRAHSIWHERASGCPREHQLSVSATELDPGLRPLQAVALAAGLASSAATAPF